MDLEERIREELRRRADSVNPDGARAWQELSGGSRKGHHAPVARWASISIAGVLVLGLFSWGVFALHTGVTPVGSIAAHRYSDQLGWSIEVPSGWRTTRIGANHPDVYFSGASFTNVAVPSPVPNRATPVPIGPDLSTFPSDAIAVTILHFAGGPGQAENQNDSRLPLSPGALTTRLGVSSTTVEDMRFVDDGAPFGVEVLMGHDVSQRDRSTLAWMIRSIRFQPTRAGTLTGQGGVQVDASQIPEGDARYIAHPGTEGSGSPSHRALMVIHAPAGFYGLALPNAPGHRFLWSSQRRQILEFSPSGSHHPVAFANRFGRLLLAPSPRYLWVAYVTVTWDGHLLATATTTDTRYAADRWKR